LQHRIAFGDAALTFALRLAEHRLRTRRVCSRQDCVGKGFIGNESTLAVVDDIGLRLD
jgi:hypothetical protein